MQLTTKGRFAVTAMIDVALRQHRGPVTLAGIGQRQRISLSYLEQLFAKLRQHRLVDSTRGPGGGYRLAKAMESISVADIVFAVDEPQQATQAGDGGIRGDGQSYVSTQELWSRLNRQMIDFLDSVSLRDLVEQQSGWVTATRGAASSGSSARREPSDALLVADPNSQEPA